MTTAAGLRYLVSLLAFGFEWTTSEALAFATRDVVKNNNNNLVRIPTIESSVVDADQDDAEAEALSSFGTKEYWDDVYAGQGDFPADQYSWYYGYDEIKRHMMFERSDRLLLPGIGNDSLLVDLLQAGYSDLTAQDYSMGALERQIDLLEDSQSHRNARVKLSHSDVKNLPFPDKSFDGIIEKGLLDAVYLSGEANLEAAVQSLTRCLKPNGMLISVSGVVPAELRFRLFAEYEWLRDGTDDLKAGCFVLRKRQ